MIREHLEGDTNLKLIIQIPCFNEANTLPGTLRDLPREIDGISRIETLIVDDGSTDGTSDVARAEGVDHIVRLPQNRGLARAFSVGLEEALKRGADIIVNTDGDNQYKGAGIGRLIEPILKGRAEMVVGDRQVASIKHFSKTKIYLQKLGSWVVRWASGTDVPDATSGFRAFSREAALHVSVYSSYTYTLETIIQAGKKGIAVTSVEVETNEMTRESRLIRSLPGYVLKSAVTILRIFLMYESLRVFLSIGFILMFLGSIIGFRFLTFYLAGAGQGHIQSLIFTAILVILGFLTCLLGLLADLIARNRQLSEESRYHLRKMEFSKEESRSPVR
jgi:glycosyltransferase involved in cell wall biosynthesis